MIVFAAGFVLGTLRVTVVVPQLGVLTAVLIELPIMLAISWLMCRRIVTRYAVPGTLMTRVAMGGIAFTCLMAAELGVAVIVFEQSVLEYLASFGTTAGALGLLMQIGFALIPVIQLQLAHGAPQS
jgi:hypothetical protein